MKRTFPLQAALMAILILSQLATGWHLYAGEIPEQDEIKRLVNKWNDAINTRSITTLKNLYGTRVLFYARDLSRSKCVLFKQDFLRKNPEYSQRIASAVTFKVYRNGVTKCEFIKEVPGRPNAQKLSAYLLISMEGGKYQITGEGDYETDKRLNYRLSLGPEVAQAQTAPKGKEDSVESRGNLPAIVTQTKLLEDFETFLAGDVVIKMPKMYLVLAVGTLLVTSLLLLMFRRRDGRKKSFETSPTAERTLRKNRDGYLDLNEGQAFINFVLMLFDPLFFRILAYDKSNPSTPIEIEFSHKDSTAQFSILCKYLGPVAPEKIRLASPDGHYRYEQEKKTDLYLIAGVGGDASNPKEVYLIPTKQLEEEMAYSQIARFRKWGMFYYNAAKKLQ